MSIGVAIPKPADFRKWVQQVAVLLSLSPYQWSIGSGIAPNALSKFINEKQQDLRLETASALVAHAHKVAIEQEKELPALPSEVVSEVVQRHTPECA